MLKRLDFTFKLPVLLAASVLVRFGVSVGPDDDDADDDDDGDYKTYLSSLLPMSSRKYFRFKSTACVASRWAVCVRVCVCVCVCVVTVSGKVRVWKGTSVCES